MKITEILTFEKEEEDNKKNEEGKEGEANNNKYREIHLIQIIKSLIII